MSKFGSNKTENLTSSHRELPVAPWFGRRTFGYGWGFPQKWQAWVVLGAYIFAIGLLVYSNNMYQVSKVITVVVALLATSILVTIAWITSGKPHGGIFLHNEK